MQVFKCAMRIVRGNIIFPLIYIVGLSFMGIFMAQSFNFSGIEQTIEDKNVEYSVVDRDQSELSQAISEFLETRGIPVEIEDSQIALQDAVAKGQTDYILIVPDDYEASFCKAVEAGDDLPQMQVIFSYYSAEGSLVNEMVNMYLSTVRTLMLESPSASLNDVLSASDDVVANRADVQVIDSGQGMSEADRFIFYLQWSTYTLFAGIVVCIGMLTSTMNRADVRRRNLSSPLSYASYNVQLALSCAVFAVVACAWSFALGCVAFPTAVAGIPIEGIALCALSMLAYSFMALAFGFMLGQFGASVLVCNAFGNIAGMVISFFGGAWISLDLMSQEVMMLAHWMPGFWYTEACRTSAHIADLGAAGFGDVFIDVGILVLFGLAFLSIGFVAARQRLQTSEAGGNRAAEVVA